MGRGYSHSVCPEGLGEHRELPQRGQGRAIAKETNWVHSKRHRTLVVARYDKREHRLTVEVQNAELFNCPLIPPPKKKIP